MVTRNQLRKACKEYKVRGINKNSSEETMMEQLLLKMSYTYDMGFSWCLGLISVQLDGFYISEGNKCDIVNRKAIYEVLKKKNNIFNY